MIRESNQLQCYQEVDGLAKNYPLQLDLLHFSIVGLQFLIWINILGFSEQKNVYFRNCDELRL